MSSRVTICGCLLSLAFLTPVAVNAQRQSATGTNASPVSVAPSAAAPSKDRLQDLEDQLSKALESFSPKGLLEAKPEPQLPPPVMVVPNRRVKSDQEKRKNWMAVEPDDLLQDKSAPDWLNSSSTSNEKKKTELDLFYERLNQQRSLLNQKGHLNPDDLGALSNPTRMNDNAFSKEEKLPDDLKGPAGKLRDLLRSDESMSRAPQTSLSDFLGLNQNSLTPEQIQAHKDLMEQYRKVIAGSSPALTPLNSAAGPSTPAMPSLTGVFHASQPVSAGMVGSIFNPLVIPDHNATVLNQWNPLYAPPKVETPKAPVVADPPLDAPRRKF